MGEFKGRILVVEDEEAIRNLIGEYLSKSGYRVGLAEEGNHALAALAADDFDLVLSDVRMPGMDGIELLRNIGELHKQTGVLMLSACEDVGLAVQAMKLGALDYLCKPFQITELDAAVRTGLAKREEKLRDARRLERLQQIVWEQARMVREALANVQEASETTLDALVAALDAREHETQAHSRRVGEFAVHLAGMLGVSGEPLAVIRRGAMLHDIGKIGIPDTILLKPGRLTTDEWVEMRKHPLIGYWILNGVEALRPASEIVLAHHEKFDGSGYPRGLKGEAIPLGARIFSVVDTLDAITSDRPYQAGKRYEAARAEIVRNTGHQFDPRVVEGFLEVEPGLWTGIRQNTLEDHARAASEIAPLVLA